MSRNYPCIIIGGGASGLLISHLLPSSLLIEKNSQCGLKLLITGNGACNITHDENIREFVTHYYEKRAFVSPALYSFPPEKIRAFFLSQGVETYIREDGKVFPVSMKSLDIKDALLRGNRNILYETEVLSVTKVDGVFLVETTNGTFLSSVLVIATGGKSYIETGSTGDGYRFAQSLGHTITELRPALSPLKTEMDVSSIEGVSLSDVTLSIGKISYSGPVVFTRRGISGPAVQNISRYVSGKTELIVRFVPSFNPDEIKKKNGKSNIINALHSITDLPSSFLSFLLSDIEEKNVASVTKNEIREIERRLLHTSLSVTQDGGEKKAMVTRGGVSTGEVDSRTMESKIVPGLYFTGEVLDVDGECGGYNLSFAFASANLAAESIRKRM